MSAGRKGIALIGLGAREAWSVPYRSSVHRCLTSASSILALQSRDYQPSYRSKGQLIPGKRPWQGLQRPLPSGRNPAKRDFHSSRQTSKSDFYDVLGVGRGADSSEIKKKYFELAKKYHPDKNQDNPDAKKKFQEITEAYEVLGNAESRSRYDQFGHAGVDPNMGGGPGGQDPFAGFSGFGTQGGGFSTTIDPNDLFEQLFGAQRRPQGPRKGRDLQMRVQLSFLEAAFGTKREVNVTYMVVEGKERRRKSRQVTVDIPAGVESGVALQMPQEGAEGEKGAPRGDLYVQIHVTPDPYFERDGPDLHVTASVGIAEAALGCKVDVLTIDGMVEMTVPKGSQPGNALLLRGRGLPRITMGGGLSRSKGDQIVHIKVEVPTKLSKRQRDLLEEFRAEEEKEKGETGQKKGVNKGKQKSTGGGDAFKGFTKILSDAYTRLKKHTGTD